MPDRMRGVKSDSPEQESADDALKRIVDGFQHFRREVFPEQQALFKKLANSQRPRAMFITCADSRIVPGFDHPEFPRRPVRHPQRRQRGAALRADERWRLHRHRIRCAGAGRAPHHRLRPLRLRGDARRARPADPGTHADGQGLAAARRGGTHGGGGQLRLRRQPRHPRGAHRRERGGPGSITCAPTPRWPRAWPAGNCSSTAGCTTSRVRRSAPTTPSRVASCPSTASIRCRWPRPRRAT